MQNEKSYNDIIGGWLDSSVRKEMLLPQIQKK
jgi:hypothetical protein